MEIYGNLGLSVCADSRVGVLVIGNSNSNR